MPFLVLPLYPYLMWACSPLPKLETCACLPRLLLLPFHHVLPQPPNPHLRLPQ